MAQAHHHPYDFGKEFWDWAAAGSVVGDTKLHVQRTLAGPNVPHQAEGQGHPRHVFVHDDGPRVAWHDCRSAASNASVAVIDLSHCFLRPS